MSFERALDIVLNEEGGYQLSKLEGDSGGMTYAGIARNKWPDWSGWILIDAGDYGSTALRSLVPTFYAEHFWKPLHCEELPERLAIALFDFGVNAGTVPAVTALQRGINILQKKIAAPLITVDGALGLVTLAHARLLAAADLLQLFFAQTLRYYMRCKGWETFHTGWIDRVADEMERI